MTPVESTTARRGFLVTPRTDAWWVYPLLVLLGFSAFIVYSTWAALQGAHYTSGRLLSPFYSPELFGDSAHSWFGPFPEWFPSFVPRSPALLILWAPGLFRFTCYYYRGAYYKGFWGDPPACAVGELRNTYLGENSFPLIFQNVHRYFLYLAIPFVALLSFDGLEALWFDTGAGGTEFGVSVGSLVLLLNAVLIGGYVFGCHAFRHLIGGALNVLSNRPGRKRVFECVSRLNRQHMVWAWCSLIWVGFSDAYVRLCSTGVWQDWRLF